ncbi:MAG: preprotein translocase subunit YajC [Candidatus Kaelpia aquatica]|nr:preprotein translocase subunit YajC [Candidatus Kaelpia aquatica]
MILAQVQAQPNPMATLFPLILIFFIFYFLLIRPQHKKQKEHNKMMDALEKGDSIVTIGGVHGVIQDIKKGEFLLKIDDNTKILLDRSAVARVKKSSE